MKTYNGNKTIIHRDFVATPNQNICIRAVTACKQSILCHPLLNQPNRPQKQRASFDTLSIVFAIDEVETE